MKHTSGPWTAVRRLDNTWAVMAPHYEPFGPAPFDICNGLPDEEANLIAAAPELLEALENLITVDDELLYPVAIEQARRAIKKARGEA